MIYTKIYKNIVIKALVYNSRILATMYVRDLESCRTPGYVAKMYQLDCTPYACVHVL